MNKPQLIPSSRRYWKSRKHAYGWEVGFRQSIRWPDGQVTRHLFRDIGTDRSAAIFNALRCFPCIADNNHRDYCRA